MSRIGRALAVIAGLAVAGVAQGSGLEEDAARAAAPMCGNGRVEAGEQCDDGNHTHGDGCDGLCAREPLPASCGNGVVELGESCDDGNADDDDGCDARCRPEASAQCDSDDDDDCEDD